MGACTPLGRLCSAVAIVRVVVQRWVCVVHVDAYTSRNAGQEWRRGSEEVSRWLMRPGLSRPGSMQRSAIQNRTLVPKRGGSHGRRIIRGSRGWGRGGRSGAIHGARGWPGRRGSGCLQLGKAWATLDADLSLRVRRRVWCSWSQLRDFNQRLTWLPSLTGRGSHRATIVVEGSAHATRRNAATTSFVAKCIVQVPSISRWKSRYCYRLRKPEPMGLLSARVLNNNGGANGAVHRLLARESLSLTIFCVKKACIAEGTVTATELSAIIKIFQEQLPLEIT